MSIYAKLASIQKEDLGDKVRVKKERPLLRCTHCGARWRQQSEWKRPRNCISCNSEAWDHPVEEPVPNVDHYKIPRPELPRCGLCGWAMPESNFFQGKISESLMAHAKTMHKAYYEQLQAWLGEKPVIATRELGIDSKWLS